MTLRPATLCAAAALFGLSACAGKPPGQDGELRGFGTPGVSAYLGNQQPTTVQALVDRCHQAPPRAEPSSGTNGLGAACAQLHRTMHNQPGNTVQTGETP